MRAAILSDIHGNVHALDAVLAEVEAAGGADEYWILGDIAAIGFDPVGAVERVRGLPSARFVRGNTDRYVVTNERPPAPTEPDALRQFEDGFRWTTARLSEAGLLSWVAALRVEDRLMLPDGTRVLLVHASPGRDDGHGFTQDAPNDLTAEKMLRGSEADIVMVGHNHKPADRRIGNVRVVNPGPISNPHPGDDRRAAYVIFEADGDACRITHRRVAYDVDLHLAALKASGFPAAPFVARHFEQPTSDRVVRPG